MLTTDTAPWLLFYAWDTDGTAKTDLTSVTAGLTIYVATVGVSDNTSLTPADASGVTDWAAGKIHNLTGNLYQIGISTASISSAGGEIILIKGTYTGGVLVGVPTQVSVIDHNTQLSSAASVNSLINNNPIEAY